MVVFISLRQTVLADVMAGYDMNSHGAGGAEAEGAEGTEAEATEEANGQHLAGHDMNALAAALNSHPWEDCIHRWCWSLISTIRAVCARYSLVTLEFALKHWMHLFETWPTCVRALVKRVKLQCICVDFEKIAFLNDVGVWSQALNALVRNVCFWICVFFRWMHFFEMVFVVCLAVLWEDCIHLWCWSLIEHIRCSIYVSWQVEFMREWGDEHLWELLTYESGEMRRCAYLQFDCSNELQC